jgi:hypothetical protein
MEVAPPKGYNDGAADVWLAKCRTVKFLSILSPSEQQLAS